MSSEDKRPRVIRSYVRRGGRMSSLQKRSYEKLSALYGVPPGGGLLDFEELFGSTKPVIVEIGFGSGKATADIAEQNRDINYIGIEVFQAGIGKLLSEIERKSLGNLRILEDDAGEVFRTMLPENSLRGIHMFFPDPWPKKKHRKRRLLQPEFLRTASGKLEDNGYFYFVTDWEDYACHALHVLEDEKSLENRYDGFAPPQGWRPSTRFEEKGIEKRHSIFELLYKKRPDPLRKSGR